VPRACRPERKRRERDLPPPRPSVYTHARECAGKEGVPRDLLPLVAAGGNDELQFSSSLALTHASTRCFAKLLSLRQSVRTRQGG